VPKGASGQSVFTRNGRRLHPTKWYARVNWTARAADDTGNRFIDGRTEYGQLEIDVGNWIFFNSLKSTLDALHSQ
jgi:hypothetical protein